MGQVIVIPTKRGSKTIFVVKLKRGRGTTNVDLLFICNNYSLIHAEVKVQNA